MHQTLDKGWMASANLSPLSWPKIAVSSHLWKNWGSLFHVTSSDKIYYSNKVEMDYRWFASLHHLVVQSIPLLQGFRAENSPRRFDNVTSQVIQRTFSRRLRTTKLVSNAFKRYYILTRGRREKKPTKKPQKNHPSLLEPVLLSKEQKRVCIW